MDFISVQWPFSILWFYFRYIINIPRIDFSVWSKLVHRDSSHQKMIICLGQAGTIQWGGGGKTEVCRSYFFLGGVGDGVRITILICSQIQQVTKLLLLLLCTFYLQKMSKLLNKGSIGCVGVGNNLLLIMIAVMNFALLKFKPFLCVT